MRCLFIGGHNDGRRVEVHNAIPIITLPVKKKPSIDIDEPSSMSDVFTTEHFEPIRFEACGEVVTVYGLYGISPYQVLASLINCYPNPESKSS